MMIEHAISRETFLKGLKYYLDEMKFQAANSDKLADGLQKSIDEDQIALQASAKDIIDSWSLKSGYPLVTVKLSADEKTLLFTQQKFSYTGETSSELFIIPINYASATTPDFDITTPVFWLDGNAEAPQSAGARWKEGDWIVVNKQETSYYRVNYDEKLWSLLAQYLMSDGRNNIHHLNRAQIVDDALNLARAGYIPYTTAFRVTRFLAYERDFPAWVAANTGFNFLNRQLLDSRAHTLFKRYVQELIDATYDELTLEDGGLSEEIGRKTLRNIGIRWSCLTENSHCIQGTAQMVDSIIQNPESEIEPNTRETIYCYGLREVDQTKWNSILTRFNDTADLASRTVLLTALGCNQNPDIQKEYLLTSINSEEYRRTERNRILTSVYTNGGKSGLENSIEFLQQHHEQVEEIYNQPSPVKRAVTAMSELVTSEALATKFFAMVDVLIQNGALTAADRVNLLETTESNIEWLKDNEDEIFDYLDAYYSASTLPVISGCLLVVVSIVSLLM